MEGPPVRTHSPCGSFCQLCGRRQAVGQNQGWSARSSLEVVRQNEILRLRVVAFQDSALVRSMRVAWCPSGYRRRNADGSSPSRTGRAYRDRGSRQPSLVTVGTSHIVEAGMLRRKTRRYKRAKSVLGGGGAVGFTAFFRGLSIPQVRSGGRSQAACWSAACRALPVPRGVTVVEDEG